VINYLHPVPGQLGDQLFTTCSRKTRWSIIYNLFQD